MLSYVLRRLIQAIPILVGISLIVFLIVYLSPGDPVDRFRNPRVTPEQLQRLRVLYGLDKPLIEQYLRWFTGFLQIWRPEAWGYSFLDGQPVIHKIAERVPATMQLMGVSLMVTIIFAIPIGVLAAVRQYSFADKLITTLATVGYAVPSFLLGVYVLYIGGVVLRGPDGRGLFPTFGQTSFGKDNDLLDLAWHLVLPVTSLAIQQIAGWARYMRSSMLEVLHQDYVRTARAKGLPQSRVLGKHALRNALIPIITLLGLTIPSLLAGAVITEFIFSWPGLGQLTIAAIGNRDYPVVLATSMLGGVLVIVGNLLADVLYGVVDPRIKY
ncbi:MAG TPA: ABC transporter permease [Candidatus Limnocylindrales bacterium]|nr:ABC transporter permease [Candidatus Limnocylindrales bacterium]